MDQDKPVDGQVPPTSTPSEQPVPAPVATVLGQTATPKVVDDSALPDEVRPAAAPASPADGDRQLPTPQSGSEPAQPPQATGQPALSVSQPNGDNHTIKLPVPTNAVPALAVGVLILVLLAAVAAYAFLV